MDVSVFQVPRGKGLTKQMDSFQQRQKAPGGLVEAATLADKSTQWELPLLPLLRPVLPTYGRGRAGHARLSNPASMHAHHVGHKKISAYVMVVA